LLYIDDLVTEMLDALEGHEHRCEFNGLEVLPQEENISVISALSARHNKSVGSERSVCRYCYCPITHKATLGHIVDLLHQFSEQPKTLMIPEIPSGSFAKKLYSTYLSYLPKEKVAFPLKMNVDDRGSFTELIHTLNCGQVSINISKPGITKGQHWHNTKWEFFIVVSGHGLIQERKIGTDEVFEYEVSGDNIQCVHMLPGFTHNIINLSETENLVTVMYCNEIFIKDNPDTYFEKV
jgi:UDP-2-acetamido-2,6-beta-L-arabino-hexul-4-ose reductase